MLNKILIGLVLILSIIAYYFKREADNKNSLYLNALVLSDSLKQEADGVWSKLAYATDEITSLIADSSALGLKVIELEKIIKRQEARILSSTQFSVVSGKTDTIHITEPAHSGPIEELQFHQKFNGIWVSGTATSDPPSIDITGGIIPTSFLIIMNQLKNGQYNTILTCDNPDMNIVSTTAMVVKYKPMGFWEKLELSPYVDIGWHKKAGVNIVGGLKIWRVSSEAIVSEEGLDYGGRFRVWRR